jgi:outer membrane protein
MKNSAKSLLCAALAFLGVAALQAQPAPKIVVLDLQSVFDGYYETAAQFSKLNEIQENLKKDLEALNKDIGDLTKQYNDLASSVQNNPAITATAKADAQAKGQELVGRIQRKREEGQFMANSVNEQLNSSLGTYRESTIKIISAAAVEVAKQKGANMLIDKSPNTTYRTSSFLWFDPSYEDITEAVLKKVNTGHEAEAAAAAAKRAAAAGGAGALPALPALPK